ncbi:MAG: hypothetical protein QUS14_16200 [Pyrinomonadaceae bacterium]|nr:hypothetical protein [Pyrinomonadaceae bacterium]
MKRIFPLVVASLLSAVPILGQAVSAENEFCHPDFAKFLVSQQVSESGSLSDRPKRIKILIKAANFLWSYDEETARSHFSDAYKVAETHLSESRTDAAARNRSSPPVNSDLRFSVIRAIAKKDAAWAGRLADVLIAELEKNSKNATDEEKMGEASAILNMAADIAGIDPDLSKRLFRRAFRLPLESSWFFALYTASGKNPEVAEQVYTEALQNYRRTSVRQLLILSAFPFARDRIFGPDRMSYGTSVPGTIRENPSLEAAFIKSLYWRIAEIAAQPQMTAPGNGWILADPAYMVSALRELDPIIIDRHPSLGARHAVAKSQAASRMTAEMEKSLFARENQSIFTPRSFEERLAELEDAFEKGTLKDATIVVAIVIQEKLTEEQYKKLEPWLDRIKEDKVRTEATSHFWFKRSQLAAEERRFRDAERFSERVPEAEFRALLALTIADKQLEDLNDAFEAQQTVARVSQATSTIANSQVRAKIRLALAKKYSDINPSFAINELSDAVKVINVLGEPDMTSATIFRKIEGKEFQHYAAYQLPGADIEGTFRALSRSDISLPLSNARAIEDRYLRAIAVLAVASNCIEKKKPAEVKTDGH